MKFILIFLLLSQGDNGLGPSPSVTAEFNDLPSCTKAKDVIRQTQLASDDAHYSAWLVLDCFPKGAEQK
jgi:hypothetical protein